MKNVSWYPKDSHIDEACNLMVSIVRPRTIRDALLAPRPVLGLVIETLNREADRGKSLMRKMEYFPLAWALENGRADFLNLLIHHFDDPDFFVEMLEFSRNRFLRQLTVSNTDSAKLMLQQLIEVRPCAIKPMVEMVTRNKRRKLTLFNIGHSEQENRQPQTSCVNGRL